MLHAFGASLQLQGIYYVLVIMVDERTSLQLDCVGLSENIQIRTTHKTEPHLVPSHLNTMDPFVGSESPMRRRLELWGLQWPHHSPVQCMFLYRASLVCTQHLELPLEISLYLNIFKWAR